METKNKKTNSLNMSREYRDELKTLKKNRRKVLSDHRRATIARNKQIKAITRSQDRGGRATGKVLAVIDRRVAILEGRLS